MAYEYSQIIELFEMLTLREKENLIKNLQEIIVQERNAPKKSPLEVAWTDIQRNIKKLSHYSYVDDQLEIDMIWETCENLIKSGELKNESWSSRERVLKEIILNEFFDYYGVSDPMNDLMEALCVTKEEKLLCAALIEHIGSDYMRKYGAKIYKEYGKAEKYYDYLEQHLSDAAAPYLELIEHYKASNADKAVEIAEYGLKKCKKDQTELLLYLLQHARETGDEVKIAKLIRSAKLRRAVNYDKVLEQFDQGIPRH